MANQHSFFNPLVSVAILPDGTAGLRYPLWVGPLDQLAMDKTALGDLADLPFVTDVQVELQLGYIPLLKVILTPPLKEAVKFLDSKLIEFGKSILEVRFGYAKSDTQVVYGLLLAPEVQIGEDVTITLNAQGIGGFALPRRYSHTPKSKMTPEKAVRNLIEPFGMTTAFVPGPNSTRSTDLTGADKAAFEKAEDLWSGPESLREFGAYGRTVWDTVKSIVEGVNCYMMLSSSDLDKRVLKIFPKPVMFHEKAKFILGMYDNPGAFDPAIGYYPVLEASTPNIAVFLHGAKDGILLKEFNTGTRTATPPKKLGDTGSEVPRVSSKPGQTTGRVKKGKGTLDDPEPGENDEGIPLWASEGEATTIERAKSEMVDTSAQFAVQMTVTTLGIPNILPGAAVILRGLSSRYNGRYSVLKTTHVLNTSGYVTTLEMIANSLDIVSDRFVENLLKAAEETVKDLISKYGELRDWIYKIASKEGK